MQTVTMHAIHTLVCVFKDVFRVFLGMGSQCMRFTRLSASIKTTFAFFFVSRYNACVSHVRLRRLNVFIVFVGIASNASLHLFRRPSRFFFWYGVTMYVFHTLVCILPLLCFSSYCVTNACVPHARLHRLIRLLRFPSYSFTMHAFHTLVCILLDVFRVFLGMGLQCMRFTRLSESIKMVFAFFLVLLYNVCVSHACLHRIRRLLRFPWYGITMHAFTPVSASVKTAFAFSMV